MKERASDPPSPGFAPHWIAAIVNEIAGGEAIVIPARATLGEAWELARKACRDDGDALARGVAKQFQLAIADFGVVAAGALKLVPEKVARRFVVFPLRQDDRTLTVATADPANEQPGKPVTAETAPGPVAVEASASLAVPPSLDASARGGAALDPILVVDDDPVHRAVARRALELQGFRVEEATSGAGALERVGKGESFALIITDLSMPGLGGREVVACLRAMPRSAAWPIIVATSQAEEQIEVSLMEEGADDYIRKPIDPARFVARVRAALRRATI